MFIDLLSVFLSSSSNLSINASMSFCNNKRLDFSSERRILTASIGHQENLTYWSRLNALRKERVAIKRCTKPCLFSLNNIPYLCFWIVRMYRCFPNELQIEFKTLLVSIILYHFYVQLTDNKLMLIYRVFLQKTGFNHLHK